MYESNDVDYNLFFTKKIIWLFFMKNPCNGWKLNLTRMEIVLHQLCRDQIKRLWLGFFYTTMVFKEIWSWANTNRFFVNLRESYRQQLLQICRSFDYFRMDRTIPSSINCLTATDVLIALLLLKFVGVITISFENSIVRYLK